MLCGACGHDNRGERRFCASCGGALAVPCPRCAFANLAGEKFCGGCGATLATVAPVGDRRQVAIVFVDLVGYTRMSTTLDPEEVHRLLTGFFEAVDGVCTRYGGRIDKHIGDNVMAIFGAPIAHGDDPERAVRAAIDIHRAVAAYSARVERPLAVHIGIAFGEVMASGLGSSDHVEYTVIGDVVNLAARLQEKARGGETLMSDATYRAVSRLAVAESLGPIELKGLADPIEVWRLLDVRGASPDVTRVIGREPELAAILGNLATGTLIVVRGEAGIGKSALVAELGRRARVAGWQVHAAQALDFGQGRGEGPIPTLVASLLGAGADPIDRRRVATSAHLASLLELEVDQATPNERERSAQQDAALAQLVGPHTMLVVEDVHWADQATRSRLRAVLPYCAVIVTTRLDGDPTDATWGPLFALELAPLGPEAANELAAGQLVDRELIARCVARAGGNPLFLEQLVHAATHDSALPGTLQSLVLARVDLLEPRDRAALQAASVIGQRFTLDLVRQLTEDMAWQPDAVIARRLVTRSEIGDLAFHHALILDGIYSSITHARRRELHLAAARYHARRDPALHAEHLDRAGDPGSARAWAAAAEAHVAGHNVERALDFLKRGMLRATTGADRFALASLAGQLQYNVGDAFAAEREWTAALADAPDEVGRCRALIGVAGAHRLRVSIGGVAMLDEAERLANAHDLQLELAQIEYLRGCLAYTGLSRDKCRGHYERALAIARRIGAAEWEARALSGLGDTLYAEARFEGAAQAFLAAAQLAKELGLTAYALVNRAMEADSYRYLLRMRDADRIGHEVIAAAGALRASRAEAIALASQVFMRVMAWRFDGLDPLVDRTVQRCQALGMRAFEVWMQLALIEARSLRGDTAGAAAARGKLEAMSDLGLPIFSVSLPVARMLTAPDSELPAILAELDAPLAGGPLPSIMFRRAMIDRCLAAEQWASALHQVEQLERVVHDVPYATFVCARGRAVAAWGLGDRSVAAELRKLAREAVGHGLACSFPDVDAG